MAHEAPVFVCVHVFRDHGPIRMVSHSEEDWVFGCGGPHEDEELPREVSWSDLLEQDPSLDVFFDLPVDWEAWRDSAESEWERWRVQ